MNSPSKVGLGVGIIVENSHQQIMMMQRKSQHGRGRFSIPGGLVEPGERLQDAALRELREETGLIAQELHFLGITNNLNTFQQEGVHVASVIFYTQHFTGTLCLNEPEKHDALQWYALNDLPLPLFEASELALDLLWDRPAMAQEF